MIIVAVRTIIMYVTIIAAMRFMGKRQLGQLQPSELVTTILISNISSLPIEETEIPLLSGLLPIALIVSMEIIVSLVEVKKPRFAALISGNCQIIIRDGVIDQRMMRELRYSITDVLSALRAKDVFDVRDVELGIIETNGEISIFLRNGNEQALPGKHVSAAADGKKPMVAVVCDGRVLPAALAYCQKDEFWLRQVLALEKTKLGEVLALCANDTEDYNLVRMHP